MVTKETDYPCLSELLPMKSREVWSCNMVIATQGTLQYADIPTERSTENSFLKNANEADLSYFNSFRQRGLKMPLLRKTETTQRHPNARHLQSKDGITDQILPNKLSKNSLGLSSGLLDAHFPFVLACFISQGKRLRLYNAGSTYLTPNRTYCK